MQVILENGVKIGTDINGKFFYITKVATYIKMKFNAMVTSGPVGFNICIKCPIPLKGHTPCLNALIEEFRETFASDALIAFNSDYNTFFFDFT